jgi:exosortase H (IPTLxxWG-CTERM-specific)
MIRAERFRSSLRRRRGGLRFCGLFAIYTVLAFAVLYAAQNVLVAPMNRHLAWTTDALLRLLGLSPVSRGAMVTVGGFAVEIKNNCNAVYEIGLYTAAVWAYPASLRDRLTGSVLGAAALYAVNFLRILTLLALGILHPSWFEMAHLYAWQALFLLVVGTCWLAWVSRVRPLA